MKRFIQIHHPSSPVSRPRIAAAIGVFDGVHLGHQALIRAVRQMAGQTQAEPAAITFDPHPKALFSPGGPPPMLTTLDERFALLEKAGAKVTGAILFSREVASWNALTFLEKMRRSSDFELTGVCVGEHWKFGANAAGDTRFLREYCACHALAFSAVPELMMEGKIISSSLIRTLLSEGDLAGASRRLGRPCRLSGTVVRGMGVAGSRLQTPTANLELAGIALPPDGVYAGRTEVEGRSFPVILNLGPAPTFGVTERRAELHLLGFSGDLYGRRLFVELLQKVREIRRFSSPEALKKQILSDTACAQQLFLQYKREKSS